MDELELQRVLAQRLFANPDEAAIHALNSINEQGYELGGGIFRDSAGRHTYSEPQGNKKTRTFEARLRIPPGTKLVGMYHTHPADGVDESAGRQFSQNDVEIANQLKLLSYIKTLSDGNVRKYTPGVTPTRSYRDPNSRTGGRGKVSDGELLRQALAAELMRQPTDILRVTK